MGWRGSRQSGPPDRVKAIYITLDRDYTEEIEEKLRLSLSTKT